MSEPSSTAAEPAVPSQEQTTPEQPLTASANGTGSDAYRSYPGIAVLILVALCLMIYSAYAFSPVSYRDVLLGGAITAMLAGGVCLLYAIYLAHRAGLLPAHQPVFTFARLIAPFAAYSRTHVLLTALGFFCLLVVAEISGNALKWEWLHWTSFNIQGALFWGGIALSTLGLAGQPNRHTVPAVKRIARRVSADSTHWMLFVVVIAVALGVRFWDLGGNLPIAVDDGVNFPQVFPLLDDVPAVGLVTAVGTFQTSQVYAQFLAFSLRLFGYDFFGMRVPNALLGTLHVAALYLLARALFDKRMALLAAVVLATFPPHVHFSRLTFLHIADALFGTLALAFFIRALKANRRVDWVLAGVSLGLTQYFFEAGRLYFPPLFLIWLIALTVFNVQHMRRLSRGIGLFLASSLLIAMPTYYATIARGLPLSLRMDASAVTMDYWRNLFQYGDLDAIANRLARPFLSFVHYPESASYYAGSHPMVMEVLVPFFLLGLFYLLWWWRTPIGIVPLWLLTTGGANLLMAGSGEYPRFIVGYGAIALTIAAGVYYVLPLLMLGINKVRVPRTAVILTAAAALLIGVVQANFYFSDHIPALKRQLRTLNGIPDVTDAVLRAAELPPEAEIVLITGREPNISVAIILLTVFRWEVPEPRMVFNSYRIDQVTAEWVQALPRDRRYAFFIEPGHPEIVALLDAAFVLDAPRYSPRVDIPPGSAYMLYMTIGAR